MVRLQATTSVIQDDDEAFVFPPEKKLVRMDRRGQAVWHLANPFWSCPGRNLAESCEFFSAFVILLLLVRSICTKRKDTPITYA
jgi:hypothetical protein